MSEPGEAFIGNMSGNTASPPDDFFEDSACKGADTSVFFPVSENGGSEAKAICAACPVAEQCLEYAIQTHQPDGIWGGLSAVERHRLVRRRQKLARERRDSTAA